MNNFCLRPVFLVFILTLTTTIFAQYPDRYSQYRSIPEGNANWQKALDFYASEKPDSALLFAERAEEDFLTTENWEAYLYINNFRGQLLGEVKEPRKALEELKEVRSKVLENIDTLSSAEYAENLFLSAKVYTLVNDYKSCENYFKRTVTLLDASGRYPEMKALVSYMLSRLYDKMMRAEDEQKYLNIALGAVKNSDNDYSQAVFYYLQGERLDRTQLYLKADFYEAATKSFERGGFTDDYLYYYTLMKLTQQFSSYQSDLKKAESYSRKAEDYARTNNLSNAKAYGLWFAIGDMYRSFEKYEESLKYMTKADSLIRSVFDKQSFEYLLSNLYKGRLYRYMDRYQEAADCFYTAWDIGRNNWDGRFPHEFTMYGEMGRLYANQGRPDSTLFFAQQRLVYGNEPDSVDINEVPPVPKKANTVRYYNSLIMKIEAYRQLYSQSHDTTLIRYALNHCQKAFDLLKELNQEAMGEDSGIKNSLRTKAVASYAVFFNLENFTHSRNEKYLLQAIEAISNSQGNYLTHLIQERKAAEMSPAEEQLRENIKALEVHMFAEEEEEQAEGVMVDSLLALKSQLVEIVLGSSDGGENEEVVHRYIPGVNVDSLQKVLPAETALMFYHVNDFKDGNEYFQQSETEDSRQLVSLLLTHDHVSVSVTPFGRSFKQNLGDYIRGLKTGDQIRLAQGGSELSEILLDPFLKKLENKSHLVILADSEFGNLPFESLPFGPEQGFLCRNFATSYHYSLGLWARSLQAASSRTKQVRFAAVAPDFSGKKGFISGGDGSVSSDSLMRYTPEIMRDGEHLDPLPQARKEVIEIGEMFRKSELAAVDVEYLNATKELFLKFARHSDILHVASHGVSDVSDYRNSGLFFSRSSGMESFLRLNEIYRLKTDARLVVLSACKTNVGHKAKGEGVMALPRGFILAGVPNVIASLWKVHDQKTREFMVGFYRYFLSGNSYSEALRLVRLDSIKKGWMPLDWAGFVLIGS